MSAPEVFDADRVADLCVQMVTHCRDAGDTITLVKMLALTCSAEVPEVRGEQTLEHAAGGLLLSALSIIAVELNVDVRHLQGELARGIEYVRRRRHENVAKNALAHVPGGAA